MKTKLIGIVGRSQSGKDTLARIIATEIGTQTTITSFAAPLKVLIATVFQCDHETLWGPSELRNAPDPRYGLKGTGLRARLDGWLRSKEITQEQVGAHYRFHQDHLRWLKMVLPEWEFTNPWAAVNLYEWMDQAFNRPVVTPRYWLQTLGDWGRKVSPSLWVDAAMRRVQYELGSGAPAVIISDVRYPATEGRRIRDAGGELWRIRRPSIAVTGIETAGIKGHSSEKEIDSLEMDALVTKNIPNDATLDVLHERIRAAMKERLM